MMNLREQVCPLSDNGKHTALVRLGSGFDSPGGLGSVITTLGMQWR